MPVLCVWLLRARVSFEPADIVSHVMSFGSNTPIEVAVSGASLPDSRAHSFADQLVHARAALSAAEKTLTLARERKAFAVGEVLENIQAEQDLTRARLDYLAVVTENNRAQFLLRRAVGDAVRTLKAKK